MAPARQPHPGRPDIAQCITGRPDQAPIVGRSEELDIIEAVRGTTLLGNPRAVMLAGEAGIGKSRLLRAATANVQDAGGTVFVGRCMDEQGMPPFVPWITALHSQSTDDDARAKLLALLSGVESGADQQSGWTTPEQLKLRLFANVADYLATIARHHPVLMCLDDLQWSDAASNELLRYVMIHAQSVPLLVMGAFRDDEGAVNPALQRTLEELNRHRLITVIPVTPLTAMDTAEQVALLTGQENEALSGAIHDHCEGNPFFTEEVLRALANEGRLHPPVGLEPDCAGATWELPVPRSVVAVIERRFGHASDGCRETLELAALSGNRVQVDLLAAAMQCDPARVVESLEEAVSLALLQPASEWRHAKDEAPDANSLDDFVFLHDRIRETIEATINTVRRREFHERLASALESIMPGGDELPRLSAVTWHLRRAGQFDRAAHNADRLGDAAMRALAYHEAIDAFRIAIDLTPETGRRLERRSVIASLNVKLGDALSAAEQADSAVAVYGEALREFVALDDRWRQARTLRRLGTTFARQEKFDMSVAQLESAIGMLEALDESPDSRARTDRANELAMAVVELGAIQGTSLADYESGIANGRRGLTLASRLAGNGRQIEPYSQLSLGKTLMRAGELEEGYEALAPALPLAYLTDDKNLAAEIAGALANHHYWVGDLDASERAARRRHDLAVQAGNPFSLRHTSSWLANLALARGKWSEARRMLDEAEREIRGVESPEPHAFLQVIDGLLYFHTGRPDEATMRLERAIVGFRRSGPATVIWYIGCLAHAYLESGNRVMLQQTTNEVRQMIDTLPSSALPRAPALAQLGIIAARTGDVDAARSVFKSLRQFEGQLHWVSVDRVLGMLAVTLRDHEVSEHYFRSAESLAARGGILPELALTLAERGSALMASTVVDTRSHGEALLRDGIERLNDLGMVRKSAGYTTVLRQAAGATVAPPAGWAHTT